MYAGQFVIASVLVLLEFEAEELPAAMEEGIEGLFCVMKLPQIADDC